MIRRGFWLATGAVLGVAGYRRLTRLSRQLSGADLAGQASTAGGVIRPGQLEVERGERGSPAGGTRRVERRPKPGTIARVAATVSFIRDVRAGMAEYSDLHRSELARNLRGRSDRISSGRSGASDQGSAGP